MFLSVKINQASARQNVQKTDPPVLSFWWLAIQSTEVIMMINYTVVL